MDLEGELLNLWGLGDLDHACAITVHKSQGSQYRTVVIRLYASAGQLLTR